MSYNLFSQSNNYIIIYIIFIIYIIYNLYSNKDYEIEDENEVDTYSSRETYVYERWECNRGW
jgi:amino acid permease